MKPLLLDLFCGAGGASVGYHRAGFEVVGVDIAPQKNYPFEFVQADARDYLLTTNLSWFDAIHASPPCQGYSRLAAMHPERKANYPRLIEPIRTLLNTVELPYVIENVEGAPLHSPVVLCGSMFGLGVERGHLRRHRLFECSFETDAPPACNHVGPAVGVYGHGGHSGKHRMLYKAEAMVAMGIDWMTRDEMTQAIPPAYSEWIGTQLLAAEIPDLGEFWSGSATGSLVARNEKPE